MPLVFSCPGLLASGVRSDALVELLDKTATILDLTGTEIPGWVQGRSLMPILSGEAAPGEHRDFVRSEYFDALSPVFTDGKGTFATMYRDRRHKLVIYHGHGLGELYDLESDPHEFDNLWDLPQHRTLRDELIHASFDAHVLLTTDVGSRRIAPM